MAETTVLDKAPSDVVKAATSTKDPFFLSIPPLPNSIVYLLLVRIG
jgi:hypothetical protein